MTYAEFERSLEEFDDKAIRKAIAPQFIEYANKRRESAELEFFYAGFFSKSILPIIQKKKQRNHRYRSRPGGDRNPPTYTIMVTNWNGGTGDFDFAIGVYFYLRFHEPDQKYADAITASLSRSIATSAAGEDTYTPNASVLSNADEGASVISPLLPPSLHGFPCRIITHAPSVDGGMVVRGLAAICEVVDLDLSELDDYGDLNEYYADIAYHLNRQVVFSLNVGAKYESTYQKLAPLRSQLLKLKTAQFENGGRSGLFEALRSEDVSDKSKRANELALRLKKSAPDTLDALDIGRKLLSATLLDIVDCAKDRTRPVALAIHGSRAFPSRLFQELKRALAGSDIEVTLCGPLLPHSSHTWPNPHHYIPDPNPRAAADPEIPQDARQAMREIGLSAEALESLIAICGINTPFLFRCFSNVSNQQADILHTYWQARFPSRVALKKSIRSRVLLSASRRVLSELENVLSLCTQLDTTDHTDEFTVAILQCVFVARTEALDRLIVKYARGDGRFLRGFGRSIGEVAELCLGLPDKVRVTLKSYEDTITAVANSDDRAGNVRQFYQRFCREYEKTAEDDILSKAYYQLAYWCYVQGHLEEARAMIDLSLYKDDENFQARNLSGLLFRIEARKTDGIERNKAESAAKDEFEIAVLINNSYSFSNYNIGVLLEESGELEMAANHYIAALLVDPDFYEALYNLSNVLLRLGCFVDAAMVSDVGIQMGQVSSVELISNLAIALIRAGYLSDGRMILEELNARIASVYVRYNLAAANYLLGRPNYSRKWLTKAVELDPDEGTMVDIDNLRQVLDQGTLPDMDALKARMFPGRAKNRNIDVEALFDKLRRSGVPINGRYAPRVVKLVETARQLEPMKYASKAVKERVKEMQRRNEEIFDHGGWFETRRVGSGRQKKRQVYFIRLPSYSGG